MLLNIITISKDDPKGLIRTIESTKKIRENYDVSQYIIDGSNNQNYEKNKKVLNNKKNIKIYRRKPNGISDAFNYGLTKISSKWVWFLNGGDTLYNGVSLKLLTQILKETECDMLIFELVKKNKIIKHPSMLKIWPPLMWVPHPATIVKTKSLEKIGGFDKKYNIAMDADLWIRLFGKGLIVDMVSIPLACLFPGGLSSNINLTKKEVAKKGRTYILFA